MTTISAESELLPCFRELDRAEVELAAGLRFPLEVEEFFAWSVGPRAFLLFRDQAGRPHKGIVFRRSTEPTPDVAAMCDWCHAVRAHGGVKLLTARRDERRQVGIYLCSDLGCLEHAGKPPDPNDFDEGLSHEERKRRILARISTFASRRLF